MDMISIIIIPFGGARMSAKQRKYDSKCCLQTSLAREMTSSKFFYNQKVVHSSLFASSNSLFHLQAKEGLRVRDASGHVSGVG